MAKISEICRYVEELAPTSGRCSWDNDGLQVWNGTDAKVHRVLVCLDVTVDAAKAAKSYGAELIISHHPLMFSPLKAINPDDPHAELAIYLLNNSMSQLSAHTRLDKASGGVNDVLATLLGIRNAVPFGEDGMGRIGTVDEMSADKFAEFVKNILNADSIRYVTGSSSVKTVAVLGGAGKDEMYEAFAEGADAYVTGDVSYTCFTEAERMGLTLIDGGHYFTEFPVCGMLKQKLSTRFPELEIQVYFDKTVKEI